MKGKTIVNPTSGKSVVILGATSGVARPLAGEFARRGYAVGLAGRDLEELERLAADLRTRYETACHVLRFDALAFQQHEAFPGQCAQAFGTLPDGIVLCFGYMADQERAQADFETARRTIDTNLTGAVSILERFATPFALRGAGFIAALSSVAGDRGRKANYIYGASKAGLSAYLQGLRNRLYASGVRVTTVKPGFMDTPMTFGMNLPALLTASPEAAAAAIAKAVERGSNVTYVSFFWRYIMWIIRSIPEFQFKKMSV